MRVRPLFVGNFPMHPTPQQIARIVSGTVRGDRVLFNGLPGVHFDTKATHVSIHCIEQYEDGCWVHTFSAKDDPIAIRDFINEQLGNRFVPNKSNGAHCEPSGADIDAAVMAVIAKQERGRVDTKNIVAIYDYRDADETLLYQVRRHETPKSSNPLDNTKTFSYRRQTGAADGLPKRVSVAFLTVGTNFCNTLMRLSSSPKAKRTRTALRSSTSAQRLLRPANGLTIA